MTLSSFLWSIIYFPPLHPFSVYYNFIFHLICLSKRHPRFPLCLFMIIGPPLRTGTRYVTDSISSKKAVIFRNPNSARINGNEADVIAFQQVDNPTGVDGAIVSETAHSRLHFADCYPIYSESHVVTGLGRLASKMFEKHLSVDVIRSTDLSCQCAIEVREAAKWTVHPKIRYFYRREGEKRKT